MNGAQFLNTTLVFASPPVAVMFPVTWIYASEQSQKFALITFVSNLMLKSFLFPSPYSAFIWSLTTCNLLVSNSEDSLSASPNKFTIFSVSILYIVDNQTMVAEFCVNWKVVLSDFSMMKILLHYLYQVSIYMPDNLWMEHNF